MQTTFHVYFSIHDGTFSAPPVAERFCAQTGKRQVPSSNPGHACQPNRLEFSVVFSENRVNAG